jgi:hypothetical protein
VSVTVTNPTGGTVAVASGFTYAEAEEGMGTTLGEVQVYSSLFRPGQEAGVRFERMPAGSRARVFNVRGTCVADYYEDGSGRVVWDGRDFSGQTQPSGAYVAILEHKGDQRRVRIAIQR